MTKTKNAKTKAPAKAKVTPDIAQPIAAKPAEPAKPTAPSPVATAKAAPAPKPVEIAIPKPAAPAKPKVRLELSKPEAHSVAIAGSFNSWQPEPAGTNGSGAWVKELTIGPGRYEYMFVVDGQWIPDPNAKEFAPNPFGGQNSVLVINA